MATAWGADADNNPWNVPFAKAGSAIKGAIASGVQRFHGGGSGGSSGGGFGGGSGNPPGGGYDNFDYSVGPTPGSGSPNSPFDG